MENKNKSYKTTAIILFSVSLMACEGESVSADNIKTDMAPSGDIVANSASVELPPSNPEVETVYQTGMCNQHEPASEWLTNSDALAEFNKKLHAHIVGGSPEPAFTAPDFNEFKLLVMYAGTKPTPGYGLSLKSAFLNAQENRWDITVNEDAPPADRILMQVLTAPCTVIKFPVKSPANYVITNDEGATLLSNG